MKNKRQFAFCTKRTVFVALFLVGVLISSAVTTFILNASAQFVPVASVEITSSNSNFDDNDPGAWKVTKSAEWTGRGKAKITFTINSIPKYDNAKKHDIILAIDNSGSMGGNKMTQVKTDATDLVDSLLSDSDNKVALITFETTATILSNFTNDKTAMLNLISNISTTGCTNYYDGLVKAQEVLEGYEYQSDRELLLLFLTDGYPNEQTPNEVAQYHLLKKMYPYMTINGIQYEMGDVVLQPIINISDNQFIASMSTLNNVLFEASITPYFYEDFVITDFINDEYWTVAGLEALDASLGEVGLEYDGATPKVVWDLGSYYRSGYTATLTIEVSLRDEFIEQEGNLLPTNTHEIIESVMSEIPDEEIDSPSTPILKDTYDVIYSANAPVGCDLIGIVPETTTHTVYSPVEITNNQLSCSGYDFKGWTIVTEGVERINGDYFRMPGKDVYISAVWARPSISKSMDGAVHTRATATLTNGSKMNRIFKTLAGQVNPSVNTDDYAITAIRRADTLPSEVDIHNSDNILSSEQSELPVYAWFDNDTIYYYTEADDIYMDASSGNIFENMRVLTDISGLAYWNSSRVETMASMFWGTESLTNIDALIYWDTSKCKSFSYMFYGARSLENIDGAINWDVSKVTDMAGMFMNNESLNNIGGAALWDTPSLIRIDYMFYYAKQLSDISGAENWDISNVESLGSLFAGTAITNTNALKKWNTSNVKNMSSSFYATRNLTDLTGLADWETSKVTSLNTTFYSTGITSAAGLEKWKTSNVTNMNGLFNNAQNLSDISALSGWNTSNVTDMGAVFSKTAITNTNALVNWQTANVASMASMFEGAVSLSDISALSGWNTSNVTTIQYIFRKDLLITDLSALAGWNTTSLTNIHSAFSGTGITSTQGLGGWTTSNMTKMSFAFYDAKQLSNIDALANWVTDSVTEMSGVFKNTAITSATAIGGWNTSNVTKMNSLFEGCTQLTDISSLADWDTSNVTTMSYMFNKTDITNISALDEWVTPSVTDISYILAGNGQLSDISVVASWDTSNVTNFANVFYEDESLSNIDALASWDVSSATNIDSILYRTSITNLNALRGWDVSNVTNMYGTFRANYNLTDISALEDWETTSVTSVSWMFADCKSLADISALSSFNTSNVTNMSYTFYGTNSLQDISALASWDTSNVTDLGGLFMSSHITDVTPLAGWNTSKVKSLTYTFYYGRYVPDYSPINTWDTSSVTDFTNTFLGVPDTITLPTWYH